MTVTPNLKSQRVRLTPTDPDYDEWLRVQRLQRQSVELSPVQRFLNYLSLALGIKP